MKRPGHGPDGLTALLDAMELELLAAPVEEVREALQKTGRARDVVCQEVRSVLDKAVGSRREAALDGEPRSGVSLAGRARNAVHRH